MKTAMKRLLSLVLVAMMLVSIMPFQASATAGDKITLNVRAFIGDSTTPAKTGTYEAVEGDDGNYKVAADNLIAAAVPSDAGALKCVYIGSDSTQYKAGEEITLNDTDKTVTALDVSIMYEVKPQTEFDVEAKVAFEGFDNVDVAKKWTNVSEITSAMLVAAAEEAQKNTTGAPKAPQYTLGTPKLLVSGVEAALPYKVTKDLAATDNLVIQVPVVTEYKVDLKVDGVIKETLYTTNHILRARASYTPEKDDYKFLRWDSLEKDFGVNLINIYDTELKSNLEFHARFETASSSTKDGKSDLKVVAKYYVGGLLKGEATLKTYADLDDGTNVYDFLKRDAIKVEISGLIRNQAWNADSEWIDGKYYENDIGSEEIDSYDTLDGNRTVYVMVGRKGATKVQLYVHTTYKTEPTYIVNIFGFEAGDRLDRDDIKAVLKEKWPNRTYYFEGMYTDDAWTDVLGGKQNVTPLKVFPLDDAAYSRDYDLYNIHIYATLTSSTADSSNPKTGDTVLMAVTVLGISASALAVLYFLNKKKQSV